MRIFMLLLLPLSIAAMTGVPVREETLAVSTSAVGITSAVCGDSAPGKALLQVQGNQIYYRLDLGGATPDSGDYLGSVGDIIEVDYPGKFRAIRVAADATVKVTCFE